MPRQRPWSLAVMRPRARAVDAGELQLPTFAWAGGVDPLNAATMAAIAAGVSTRRYRSTVDALPPGEESSATSSSAVSRRFVALSQQQLDDWLSRRLGTLDLPVVMTEARLNRPGFRGGCLV